ncbi:MAG TPA: hypothetical protein VLM85_15760, partial [Polyangiaceae bacterium]|nr:hypothetical protein [Polyangiaceae bacterium]
MSEPPEDLPPELRELVGDMRRDALEPERVARVAERLGPIVGPSGGGGGGPPGSAGAGRLATLGKIAASALVLGAVAALTVLPHARRPPATERPAVAVAPPEPVPPTTASSVAAAPSAVAPAAPAPAPSESAPHHSARATPRPAAAPSERAGGYDLAAEEALLLRAREALASSPQTALALADEHAK